MVGIAARNPTRTDDDLALLARMGKYLRQQPRVIGLVSQFDKLDRCTRHERMKHGTVGVVDRARPQSFFSTHARDGNSRQRPVPRRTAIVVGPRRGRGHIGRLGPRSGIAARAAGKYKVRNSAGKKGLLTSANPSARSARFTIGHMLSIASESHRKYSMKEPDSGHHWTK